MQYGALDPPVETAARPQRPESSAINIRRARLSDYPRIATFIEEAYAESAPYKGRDRWNWQFVNDPYIRASGDLVPVWIAETAGKVVGQVAVQEGDLQIDGSRHPAGWVVDVMILPSYRGHGLGHRLYAAVVKDCPVLVTLTMAEATRRMAERVGATDLGTVQLFSRIVRLNSQTVERYLRARTVHHPRVNALLRILCSLFLHRALACVGNLWIAARNALARMPEGRKRTQIVEVHRFGPEIDLLWHRVAADFPVAFARESKWLNWRFVDCPQMRYRIFTASRDGDLVGYMVLRESEPVELPKGVIVDLLAAKNDRETVEELVAFAIEVFGDKVANVESATSIPDFAGVLRRFGFHSIRTEKPNCVVSDDAVRERLAQSANDWFLSKADHDWDQVYVA